MRTLLHRAGVTLCLKMCAFFKRTVECLCHEIMPGKNGVLYANTRTLQEWRYPPAQAQLKIFLGTCNVYERFVKDLASMVRPSTILTSNTLPKKSPPLPDGELAAFTGLTTHLLNTPVLSLPHSHGTFFMDVGACDTQVGYYLTAIGPPCQRGCSLSGTLPGSVNQPPSQS